MLAADAVGSSIAEVNWWIALTIAVGSVLGAQVGGRVGRKLPASVYRVVIVAVGVAAIISCSARSRCRRMVGVVDRDSLL